MTSRRAQQVEEVLRKHAHSTRFDGCQKELVTLHLQDAVEALCALQPTPSREQLFKILDQHGRVDGTYICLCSFTAEDPECRRGGIRKALLAWATGTELESKVWCPHISWQTKNDRLHYEGWLLTDDAIIVWDKWNQCPICAAPRPGAG